MLGVVFSWMRGGRSSIAVDDHAKVSVGPQSVIARHLVSACLISCLIDKAITAFLRRCTHVTLVIYFHLTLLFHVILKGEL